MKQLFSPWRDKYTTDVVRSKEEEIAADGCVFCTQFDANDDEKYFIIKRTKNHVVMLNRFPYNAGHLLIVPHEHKPHLTDISQESRTELMELVVQSNDILREALKAEGINVGMNIGKTAGAGIPAHLHMHIVPRWRGDTNFMPTIVDTKQISTDMVRIYNELKAAFKQRS